jgi:protein CpxP
VITRWSCTVAMGLVLLVGVAVPSASAQGGRSAQVPEQRRPAGAARIAMERRLQERINEVIRKRLALSDDQFSKLRDVAARLEDDRRILRNDEQTTRFALRQELLAGDRVNEARVAEMLDKMPGYERRRLDLLEQEQRELARFLSPSQRARYFALQDELRRGMQDMQRRRMGGEPPVDSGAVSPRRPLRLGRPGLLLR